MIRVYHDKNPSFGFEVPPWPDGFEFVAEVDGDSIDHAFQQTNHIDRAWYDNNDVRKIVEGTVRSTSVGDVLVKVEVHKTTKFYCMPFGWQEFEDQPTPAYLFRVDTDQGSSTA